MESFRATKRKVLGKKVKALRRQGQIPAVLVEKGETSIPLILDASQFARLYQEVGESTLATMRLGSEEFKVVVSDVECDPIDGAVLHVSFQKVRMDEKITAEVPIEIVGESAAVKRGDGILLTILSEIEVECLPLDLPPEIEVDISGLEEVDAVVTLRELPLDFEKVQIVGHSLDEPVVKVEPAEMEEVEEEVTEIPLEEIEATEEKRAEEVEPSEESEASEVLPRRSPAGGPGRNNGE